MENIREELKELRESYGLGQYSPCSPEKNEYYQNLLTSGQSLPDGVQECTNTNGQRIGRFCVRQEPLSNEEVAEYLSYKQLVLLSKKKKYVGFFYHLAWVTIVIVVVGYLVSFA